MNKFRLPGRVFVLSLAALFAALFVGVAPAQATDDNTFNNVEVNITGGKARALSACVNYAKLKAKRGEPAQSNACKNFAKAQGGDVKLKNVDITILQAGTGGGSTTKNNAEVNINGGDAVAVASCVNYLQGTANSEQTNHCKNSAVAEGGDVNLKNVSITIIQG